ncbi:DUF6502 family protein [Pseudohalioglobus lutimaris]|nr:DUF6502 family protein [Pseudohalioglobus lutimaris]
MDMTIHQALHQTVLKLLRPLVRVLINHGVSQDAFAELSRQAYVKEGFAHMASRGKRATVSGVAALTGLSRKEVKRLNEADGDALGAEGHRRNKAIRVISGWMHDPDFQATAEPAKLAIEGDGPCFAELVKRYSGDITPVAMLSLLQDSGNVSVDNGYVTLEKKAFIPMATPLDRLNILGTDAGELIETIGHNMMAVPESRLFQRKVSNALVHKDALSEFRELSNQRSQELLEEYDAWLSRHEVQDESEAAYVAVGIYYVEHTEQEITP